MNQKMILTIDTCLINSKLRNPTLNRLEELNRDKVVEIVGAERLLQETEKHNPSKEKAKSYRNISEPWTIGLSKVGRAYISNGSGPSYKDIAQMATIISC